MDEMIGLCLHAQEYISMQYGPYYEDFESLEL